MASPHIAIAKASLAAALFRPSLTVVNRESIAEFHKLLDNSISACSDSNIQKCKTWLLANVVPSTTRTAALGKYLASLAKHLQQDVKGTNGKSETFKLLASRKRLHIFYLLNDLLHHAKFHSEDASISSTFSSSLQPFLVDLMQATALGCTPKIRDRLFELLGLWEEEKYYSADYIIRLRGVLDTIQSSGSSKAPTETIAVPEPRKIGRELPFVMPSTHGDPSMPYFDLPAGNLMPHIMPNSSAAIKPDQVRALQFVPGPADDGLVQALKDFLKDVDNINDSAKRDDQAVITDTDDLGQAVSQDENGDLIGGDTYYGWSRAFCEKMKKRRDGDKSSEPRARSFSSSRSPSRSRSRSPRKRRRYSNSITSRSESRSRSGPSHRPRDIRRHESTSRRSSGDYRKRSSSRSYSPEQSNPLPSAPLPQVNYHPRSGFAQFPPPHIPPNHPPDLHTLSNQIPFQPPFGPGGVLLPPPPPPPPPNYSGLWAPSLNFPPGLPFPVPPPQQGRIFPPRPGPPGPGQNWSSGGWQGSS